jgi:hypothetical protein
MPESPSALQAMRAEAVPVVTTRAPMPMRMTTAVVDKAFFEEPMR